MAYYVTKNDITKDGFTDDPIVATLNMVVKVADENDLKRLLIYTQAKDKFEGSHFYQLAKAYKWPYEMDASVESEKTIDTWSNDADIIIAHIPTPEMISFLGRIEEDVPIFIIPSQMGEVFSIIENLMPTIIYKDGSTEKMHRISSHGKTIKEIAGSTGKNVTQKDIPIIERKIEEMINLGIRPKEENFFNTAICFGWKKKDAEKLTKIYLDLLF